LYVAPGAHLFHERSRSAPGLLRRFLVDWQEPRFNARWGEVVARLDRGEARDEPHECATWAAADMPAIERLVGREASLLVVAVAGDAAARIAELTSASAAAAAEAEAKHDRVVADFRSSASWRLTAPLRAAGRLIGKAGRD
jgi:hypothetical protein